MIVKRDGSRSLLPMLPSKLPRLTHKVAAVLILCMMAGFWVQPLFNSFRTGDNMDYNLWQRTGQIVLDGGDIYPRDGSSFPFMYPPPCATFLAPLSVLPEQAFVTALILVNSVAWAACILLSVYLATGRWLDAHPALYLWPSVAVIPLVHNTYLLGQPAIVLLALVLGCFALVQRGHGFAGGVLLAAATSIKAYPVIAAGYLVYRRRWGALAGLVCGLLAMFFLLPLVFRSPVQVKEDAELWARGMLFKYEERGIAQRPKRSYSFKNQSLQATAHRLLRPVPADGEKSEDWKVNFADLSFAGVNTVLAVSVLGLLVIYAGASFGTVLPRPSGEALEQGMAVILAVILAPLSFQYSYVWLMFPMTTLLHLALASPRGSELRRAAWLTLGTSVFLLLWSVPFTRGAAAYGNIFFAGIALYLGSALILRSGWLGAGGKQRAAEA